MWSKNFDECIKCGKNDTRHMANGLCAKCYLKDYRKKNRKKIKEKQKENYILNKDIILLKAKKHREQINFDNNRKIVIKRDNFKCTICSSKKSLVVHHKDGNGRNSNKKNNKLKNLVTLCKKCHIEVHRNELLKARKVKHLRRKFNRK